VSTALQIGIVGDRADRITAHRGVAAALPQLVRAFVDAARNRRSTARPASR
jgi:hypothetical protein